MPIKTDVWTVGSTPQKLYQSQLPSEQLLEDMIVHSPNILSEEWMLIGRQESTGMGGRIDLLAVAPDGSLVLIELERDRTPREAQTLDYAAWVDGLTGNDIAAVYQRFRPGRSLHVDFQTRFGRVLDDDELNASHQLIIVATELDASTERIVQYLSKRDIPINVLCFQVFQAGEQQLLSRSWLLDPVQTQVNAASTSAITEIATIASTYQCHVGHLICRSPILPPRHPAKNVECYQASRPLRPVGCPLTRN